MPDDQQHTTEVELPRRHPPQQFLPVTRMGASGLTWPLWCDTNAKYTGCGFQRGAWNTSATHDEVHTVRHEIMPPAANWYGLYGTHALAFALHLCVWPLSIKTEWQRDHWWLMVELERASMSWMWQRTCHGSVWHHMMLVNPSNFQGEFVWLYRVSGYSYAPANVTTKIKIHTVIHQPVLHHHRMLHFCKMNSSVKNAYFLIKQHFPMSYT